MGKRSNYFRHSFTAHQDEKIIQLIEECGIKAYGLWCVLLEMYGGAIYNDDDMGQEQTISVRRIAAICSVRKDYVLNVFKKCNQITLIPFYELNYEQTMIKLTIPNYFKYIGFYKKTRTQKSPNKIKVNKIKVNKSKTALFDFEILYQLYPRKQGKTKGMEKCIKEITTDQLYSDLKKAIENYGKICAAQNTEKKYIKQFSTFMNCWRDYLENEEVPMSIKEIFDECLND